MMSRATGRENAGHETDDNNVAIEYAAPDGYPQECEERRTPASFVQERMWFLAQLAPEVPLFHINILAELGGSVVPPRMVRALAEVVARHEPLRTALTATAFPASEIPSVCQMGQNHNHLVSRAAVTQVITAAQPVTLLISDISGLPARERKRELHRIASRDATRPFRLDTAPLWRARLVRLAEHDWRLVLVAHQAVCDEVSAENLLAELLGHDAALAAGRQPDHPESRIRYPDHAETQRRVVASGELNRQLGYWHARLAGLPADADVATDRPRRAGRCHSGAEVELPLPAKVTSDLNAFARRNGATLFATLLAGFKALLARYTGRSDIVVGWAWDGRSRRELSPLIGPLTNPLVLRTDAGGDPSFAELVARVNATVRGAIEHADVPFERLVEDLAVRDQSRPALYQVSFTTTRSKIFRSGRARRPIPPGDAKATRYRNGTTQRDLAIEVETPPRGNTKIRIRYATSLFDAETASRLATAYRTLLTAAANDHALRLSELPVLPAEDIERLVEWNGDERRSPDQTVHGAVFDGVPYWPDAGAVGHEGRWLSYRSLAARAGQIARWLATKRIGPGHIVGVCLPRGLDLAPVSIGILASGAACLPIDQTCDPRRLARAIAMAGVRTIVTARDVAPFSLRSTALTILDLDRERDAIASHDPTPPPVEVSTDATAFAMITGNDEEEIAVLSYTHRAILNQLSWFQDTLALSATDRMLHRMPQRFDTAIWELYWPLVAGAGVVISADGRHHDLCYLADLIDRERITVAHFPPNLLEPFLELPELLGLDRVICSGEPLGPQLAARCFERLPGVRLYSLAGASGVAGAALWHQCVPGERAVPAGRPITNTRVEVLDQHLARVPIGAIGELYIGGAQVVERFLGRPDLTASRLVGDPHRPGGGRLLRTGWLARWRSNGEVELLGSSTDQTLIRGVRVDMATVKDAMERHPNVHRAEAARSPEGGIIGYVRWTGNPDALADTLRRYLRTALPSALLPEAFVPLVDFPATASGVLDRSALPVAPPRGGERRSVPPSTEMERTLCAIWQEILCRPDVGVSDDFFALGGTSLLAVRLISRIREVFDVELPPRSCFELSTVADYALAVLDLRLQRTGFDIDDLVNALRAWKGAP